MIIGLSGKARAGKDTLFAYLSYRGFVKASYAEDLKKRVRRDFQLTMEHTDGKLKEAPSDRLGGHSPRELMIDYGNMFRKFNPNYWVDSLMNGLKGQPKDVKVVITDVRYPNEAEAIKASGGILIRLERHTSRDAMVDEKTKLSISETALDEYKRWDIILPGEKNETPQDLEKFSDEVMDYVQKTLALS